MTNMSPSFRRIILYRAVVLSGLLSSPHAHAASIPGEQDFTPCEQAAQADDWLCIPGVRCGPITGATTEADLIEIYGRENVTREEAWIREGSETVWASIVYKDTDGEFWIYWEESWESEEEPGNISFLQVSSPWTRWHTADGVRVGTTLDELNAVNGVPFLISGYYWGYGGWVQDWCGGALEGQTIYIRNFSWQGDDYRESFEAVESDDPSLIGLEIAVAEMRFDL